MGFEVIGKSIVQFVVGWEGILERKGWWGVELKRGGGAREFGLKDGKWS